MYCLVANDEVLQLYTLESVFKNLNFMIETAINGFDAHNKVRKAKQDGNRMFDIIILDINMPVLNGIEACKKIVKLFEHDNPIFKPKLVALTSLVTDAIEKECLDAGFNEVHLAPLTFI